MVCIRMHELASEKLTLDELKKGIILLHCKTCRRTTKHQTLNKKGKPYTPTRLIPSRKEKHRRMCLNCGTETLF